MAQNEAKRMNHKQINHILVELFKRKDEKSGEPVYTVAISKFNNLIKKWKFEKVQELTNKRKAYDLYNYSIEIYEEHFAAKPETVKVVPKAH